MSAGPLQARVVRFPLPPASAVPLPGRPSPQPRLGTLLELRDGNGVCGWGEASPLPGYAPETPAHAGAVLLAWVAGGGAARAVSRESGASGVPPDLALPRHSPAARAAVVSAWLDLAGRRSGRAVRDLLVGIESAAALPPSGPGLRGSVPLNALIPLSSEREAVTAASSAVDRGIRTIKAKLGPAERFDEELGTLRSVRGAVGPDLSIRLDANGLWSPTDARRILDRLQELDPEYVEEPVHGPGLLELIDSPVPIAADESLHDPDLASALLGSAAISVLVLKPSPLGGLDRCLELGTRAAHAGKRCVVTHSFEGPVGHAGACELALALAGIRPSPDGSGETACGLDRHAALEAWDVVRVPQLGPSELTAVPVEGLGVDASPLVPVPGNGDGA